MTGSDQIGLGGSERSEYAVRATYEQLLEVGEDSTWKMVVKALPADTQKNLSKHKVRRFLTEIRKEMNETTS